MNSQVTIIDDLFHYNDWANGRILDMCRGLSESDLDQGREMGFGSLRNTLFHILAAEEVWYERWMNEPWRPFPMQADGLALQEIADRLTLVSSRRQRLLNDERECGWRRNCQYQDGSRKSHTNRLDQLLLHVANHGIHHRAQALSYLKQFGKTVPGGLDYIFYKLARPHYRQHADAVAALRQFGLEIDSGSSLPVAWDAEIVGRYSAYGDWANERLLQLAEPLSDEALDHNWHMGMGTIRLTAAHIYDAERWWLANWTQGGAAFTKLPPTTAISELRALWADLIPRRNAFRAALDAVSAQRLVSAAAGGPTLQIPIVDSMLQIGGHGTHHRSQLNNMLRHSAVAVSGSDYVVWMRQAA